MEQCEQDGGLGSGEMKKNVDKSVEEKDNRSNMEKKIIVETSKARKKQWRTNQPLITNTSDKEKTQSLSTNTSFCNKFLLFIFM